MRLPGLGIELIKAKVDTGARTSTLHAYEVAEVRRGRRTYITFEVHPDQRSMKRVFACEAPLVGYRSVRSSSGRAETRPVVATTIELLGRTLPLELTLTRRDAMGFRMLLGRTAIRGQFLVDPGRSFLNGRKVKGADRLERRREG